MLGVRYCKHSGGRGKSAGRHSAKAGISINSCLMQKIPAFAHYCPGKFKEAMHIASVLFPVAVLDAIVVVYVDIRCPSD